MKIVITGYTDGKKIQAIKGLRGATGLGLKEAKDIIDEVGAGTPMQVVLPFDHDRRQLDEYGVVYQSAEVRISNGDLAEVLGRFRPDLTVADLVAVLTPMAELEPIR